MQVSDDRFQAEPGWNEVLSWLYFEAEQNMQYHINKSLIYIKYFNYVCNVLTIV